MRVLSLIFRGFGILFALTGCLLLGWFHLAVTAMGNAIDGGTEFSQHLLFLAVYVVVILIGGAVFGIGLAIKPDTA